VKYYTGCALAFPGSASFTRRGCPGLRHRPRLESPIIR